MSIFDITRIALIYNKSGDAMYLRIRDLREDYDLTQKQVSAYLLCDQSLYSKYERMERDLPLEFAIKLAEFYHVSLDYLVGMTDEKNPYPRRK